MNLHEGDRIRLVSMEHDPCPIAPGTTGTVTRAGEHDLGDGPFVQVEVEWDDGRRLMLCIPPDVAEVIEIGPATRKAMIDAANNYTDELIAERRKAKRAVTPHEQDDEDERT